MLQPKSLVALAIAVTLIGGCSQQQSAPTQPTQSIPGTAAVPPATPVGYACESGKTLTVQYPDATTAQVLYLNQTYALRSVPAARGARYSGSGLEWTTVRGDGQEAATLSRVGPNADTGAALLERCSRPTPTMATADPVGATPTVPRAVNEIDGDLPCLSSQLALSNAGGDAGMGNRVAVIGIQNTGAQTCSLTGYPTVTLADSRGRVLSTVRSEATPGNYFHSGTAPTKVTVAGGARAYFDLAWNVVPDESQGQTTCPSVATVRLAAPGDTATASLQQAFTPCGGRIRVGPIRPTASDTPPTT